MTNVVKTREIVQAEALETFLTKQGNGTICLSTGTGKSKVAIDFIKSNRFMESHSNIKNILITSPRTNLKRNWRRELIKWGLVESNDNYWYWGGVVIHITIENIQTVYKWKSEIFDLIIADEIHTMMTPEYSLLFKNNHYQFLMGLTATHDIDKNNDKEYYYNKYCPIIYEYYDSADDGIINKTNFFIVNHRLSNNDKLLVGTKGKQFLQGELAYYDYLTNQIKKGQQLMMAQGSQDWFTDAGNWFWKNQGTPEQKRAAMMYLNSIKYRKNFLLNLPSSARIAKKIKEGILAADSNAKILIFSELTAQVDKITKYTIHSKNNKVLNENLLDEYNEGNVRELGSCQSLTLGLNLKGATHAIMESYVGSATRSKQKKGRLDRLGVDDVADMWIINILDTQSETWFGKMTKDFDLEDAVKLSSITIMNDGFNYGTSELVTKTSSK